MEEIAKTSDLELFPDPSWGKANDIRGLQYVDIAVEFIRDFPVGTIFKADEFDVWAQKRGLLNTPTNAPKKSDAWLAHLQRRHQLKTNINKAAAHPRMQNQGEGIVPYVIQQVTMGGWITQSISSAIGKHDLPKKMVSLFTTKKRQLNYLMQSADWHHLPPFERVLAEELYEDIDELEENVSRKSERITNKYARLESKIKRALENNEIKSVNGGIKALLEPEKSE